MISKETLILIGVATTAVASLGLLISRSRSVAKRDIEDDDTSELLQREEEARKTLDDIEMKLRKESIGYYLFINYSKYGLSVNDYEKLADKYGKVLAMPSINWTVVDTYGDNTSIYQKILSEMLNVSESSKLYTLKSKFESKILSDAEKEAMEILNKYERECCNADN